MFGIVFILTILGAAYACRPCTCGVARGARVKGGEAVYPGEFPWLAALRKDGKVVCGATIVAKDHLITASHCVHEVEAFHLRVLVGEYDVNNSVSDGYEVQQVIQHPDFNKYNFDNDIAVLILSEALPDQYVRPACLPEFSDDMSDERLDGLEAIVSGWGATIENGPASSIPMKVGVQIWPQDKCKSAGYGKRKVTPRMLCANAPEKDACGGDSGGPLLLSQPYYTLVGIVSWGRGCARPDYPGVYTRVSMFMPWLQVAMRHACTCQPPSFY